jgi:hypothetical protein
MVLSSAPGDLFDCIYVTYDDAFLFPYFSLLFIRNPVKQLRSYT